MKERERLLWSVLIILLLIIAGYMGYNAYNIGKRVRGYKQAMEEQALGSEDPQLRTTVEQLEEDLRERMSYKFEIGHDPLDLTQVVRAKRLLASLGLTESLESSSKMRLSCTVMGDIPAAVIKYQGRSRVLRIGDTLGPYRLTQITPSKIIMQGANDTVTLVTERSPESLELEKYQRAGTVTVTPSDTTDSLEDIPENF
ncbi:MAG: hypothetical protein NTW14_09370 [bacterium]|nr:hypothetical protein [bacterium]